MEFVNDVLQVDSSHVLVPGSDVDWVTSSSGSGSGAVPEPITLVLSGLAVAGLGGYTRTRIKNRAAAQA